MPTHLNRYGLVAFAPGSPITLEIAQARLGIAIDPDNPQQLVDAVRCDADSIGIHDGCVLICVRDMFQFFVEPLTPFAKGLLDAFVDGQGCAVYYYSVVDLYGYAHFEKGRTMRVKYGMDKVWVDVGATMEYEDPWNTEITMDRLTEQVVRVPLPLLLDKEIPMFQFQLITGE